MGPKARKQSRAKPQQSRNDTENARHGILRTAIIAFGLLGLAVASSSVSQLALSPVYGSIPASIHHRRLQVTTVILALATQVCYHSYLNARRHLWTPYIPVIALVLPVTQSFLFKKSAMFGPSRGPILTEVCTSVPLLYSSILAAIAGLPRIGNIYSEWIKVFSVGVLSLIIIFLESVSWNFISSYIGRTAILSRYGLQYMIAAFYAMLLPSKQLGVAVLLLLYPLSQSSHLPLKHTTAVLNQTLQSQGFSLVARQESLTGYISVLENTKDGFRAMRCDHSLLGGEWIDQHRASRSQLGEPIYSCFVMLEAVRLVETASSKGSAPDVGKQALVIGLGIGTSPSALIGHGIQTTIVEIDPIVHQYAIQYFNLPTNHTAVIQDAVTFVDGLQKTRQDAGRYDYIIHDVFTGGAEPLELFTKEFLEGLSYLLNSDGVIAINYGGDLLLESASLVVNTILDVFPKCRLFREEAAPVGMVLEKDFTNMVVFCRKSDAPFTFRKPVKTDFLGSQARQHALLPEHEIVAGYFDRAKYSGKADVLRRGQTQRLAALQQGSALNHWHIMRTVIPDFVWENW